MLTFLAWIAGTVVALIAALFGLLLWASRRMDRIDPEWRVREARLDRMAAQLRPLNEWDVDRPMPRD